MNKQYNKKEEETKCGLRLGLTHKPKKKSKTNASLNLLYGGKNKGKKNHRKAGGGGKIYVFANLNIHA